MMDKEIIELSERLGKVLKQKGLTIATAESCTGGGIAQAITEIAGSSAWFDRGFVTYSNQAKVDMLQVKQSTLEQYGAVSEQVAKQMVAGALFNSHADLAVSVTGIAGPNGGTESKPVGTVYIAWGVAQLLDYRHYNFLGSRESVRQQTVLAALSNCLKVCQKEP